MYEGAHYIYNANDLSFVQEVKELTNGGVHAVINTSVSTSSASLAMYILRRCWKTSL
nr:hypothetical protein [Mycoplasmopsis bovis]